MRRAYKMHLGIALTAFLLLIVLPHVAYAATINLLGPIVPNACNCQNSAPDWGCVLQTIQNFMTILVSIGVVIVTFFIAWAGIDYMLAPVKDKGNEAAIGTAHARLRNSATGLVILLAAWLIVSTFLQVIYNPNAAAQGVTKLGPWNSILSDSNAADQCLTPSSAAAPAAANNGSTASAAPAPASTGSGACNASTVQQAAASAGSPISSSDASVLACLAKYESSCGAQNQNFHWGKGSSAYGPFQIVLQTNAKYLNIPACENVVGATGPLNCQNGFSGGNPIPGSQVAAQCEQAAANLGCSAVAGAALYDASGIGNWISTGASANNQGSCAQ